MTMLRASGTATLATWRSGISVPYASTTTWSSSEAFARPVRIAENSPCVVSTAFFMRPSRSLYSWGNTAFGPPDNRADRLSPNRLLDVAGAAELENDDRQTIVHAEREG